VPVAGRLPERPRLGVAAYYTWLIRKQRRNVDTAKRCGTGSPQTTLSPAKLNHETAGKATCPIKAPRSVRARRLLTAGERLPYFDIK
jgi:hypothetical protein